MLGLLSALLPSAISGVGGLAGSLLNSTNTSPIRRATNQAVTAYNNAGSTGAQAATTAAAIGSTASTDAAKQLSTAYNTAAGQGVTGLNNAISYLSPYAQSGTGSVNLLSDALGVNGPEAQAAYYKNFQNDPGFLASQQAGINALDQSAASGGMLRSGGQMKSLYNYGQQNMQSQFQDRLNRLYNLSGQGYNAASTNAGYMRDIGGVQGEGTIGSANATAGGILGSAAAREGGVLGTANALSGAQIAGANARTGGAQNTGILNAYGQGQINSGISDLFSTLSGPLSTYAQNYFQPYANGGSSVPFNQVPESAWQTIG